jgi:hypothetical protein
MSLFDLSSDDGRALRSLVQRAANPIPDCQRLAQQIQVDAHGYAQFLRGLRHADHFRAR